MGTKRTNQRQDVTEQQPLSKPEPLVLSFENGQIIRDTEKLSSNYNCGRITKQEAVNKFLHSFCFGPSDDAIVQSAARLAGDLYPVLGETVDRILQQPQPGELFVFAPMKPTPSEYEELNVRVRHLIAVLQKFLADPVPPGNFDVLPQDRSHLRRKVDSVSGTQCRRSGCSEPRAMVSVFCPQHHDETLQNFEDSNPAR